MSVCMGAIVSLVCSLYALIVAIAMCMVATCITLIGTTGTPSNALRPIVSINLKTSGYKLKKVENEDGQAVNFQLTKNSES